MKVRDIYNKVLAMIDEFTNQGVQISDDDNADVLNKVILFVDMAQKELWRYNKTTKVVELTLKPPVNLLKEATTDLLENTGTTQYYPNDIGVPGVYGFSVMVDGDCTVKLQEYFNGQWVDLFSQSYSTTAMTTVKSSVTPYNPSNNFRLVLSGTTYFTHLNRALWGVKYRSDRVPTFAPWVKQNLPSDFQAVDMVVEQVTNNFIQNPVYKIENYRDFYYNYDFEGILRIIYKPVCQTIISLDDDVQVDEVLANNIVYDVLAKVGFYENTDVVNWAEGRRVESKAEANKTGPISSIVMESYY